VKRGSGRRQQRILRLLSDGAPRSCSSIAAALEMGAPGVHATLAIMLTRQWVQEIGKASSWPTRVWAIADEGRKLIPAEYNRA